MSQKTNFFKSFGYAGDGIHKAFKNEPNLRFHVIAGLASLILGLILNFTAEKFAILILTIFFVITLELLNTIVEEIVNIIRPDYSEKAKFIKDLAAATVLLGAFAAALVGILLFVPDILLLLSALIH